MDMFTSGASSCGRSSKQLCKQDPLQFLWWGPLGIDLFGTMHFTNFRRQPVLCGGWSYSQHCPWPSAARWQVATICSLLNGWRGMIVEKSVSHILSCQSYEDAFGLYPDLEAHGAFINLFSVKCPYLDDCRHILTWFLFLTMIFFRYVSNLIRGEVNWHSAMN